MRYPNRTLQRNAACLSFFLAVTVLLSGCMVFRAKRFAQCTFLFNEVSKLEGVDINLKDKTKIQDLNFKEGTKLSSAILKGKLPMTITMDLDVTNPNEGLAAMNRLDWVLVLKGKEVLQGSSNQRVSVPGGGTAQLPLTLQFDLFEALKGESKQETTSFLWDLTKRRKDPKVFTVKLKPYFFIFKKEIPYPGYVNIGY